MAHFAELDADNVVTRIVVINNAELLDDSSVEQEGLGISFCQSLFGGTWKQTSYNGNLRKNFAGVGYSYDSGKDAFIPPQPYSSWTLNETSCQWESPVSYPTDDNKYTWNEETTSWDVIE